MKQHFDAIVVGAGPAGCASGLTLAKLDRRFTDKAQQTGAIVAINKDREANIFKEADFGIVGDYREALPGLIEKLKSYL